MNYRSDLEPTHDSLPSDVGRISKDIKLILRMLENLNPNREDENKPMDIDECSDFTGLAKPTIYSKCSRGEMPFHKNGSKKLWFFKQELIEWMRGGKPKTRAIDPNEALGILKKKKGGPNA